MTYVKTLYHWTQDYLAREQFQRVDFVEHAEHSGYDKIVGERAEAYTADTLLVNGHLLTQLDFPVAAKNLGSLDLKSSSWKPAKCAKWTAH